MKIIKLEQPSCSPCVQVSKYLDERDVSYEKINVWDNPESASTYGIMSVPVTILIDEDENEIVRSVGFRSSELDKMIKQLKGE